MQNRIHDIVKQLSKEIKENPETYFDLTSDLYNKDYKRMPCSNNEEVFELSFIMFWQTCSAIGEEKLNFLYQVQNTLLNHLNFYTAASRGKYLKNRLNELEENFSLNPLAHYLRFEDYINMYSPGFMKNFYMTFMESTILPEIEQNQNPPPNYRGNNKFYIEIFDHYFELIYKVMEDYLKIVLETNIIMFLLQNKNQSSESENPYPLIFQTRNYYELFRFCIDHYHHKGELKPALFSKYFMLFNYKGFLLSELKDVTFINFVKAEYGIDVKRIRRERSIGSAHIEFDSLKNNFLEITGKKDL